jgi:hypothetical protein
LDSIFSTSAVPEEFRAAAERLGDGDLLGVQVLVNGRADDHDHVLRRGHDRGIGRGHQAAGTEHPAQRLIGARFGERHLARVDRGDRCLTHVIDTDPGTPVGERDRERQANMPAPPDDNHISADLIRHIGHRVFLRLIYGRPPKAPEAS